MSEINRKRLLDLLEAPGNEQCADCGSSEPEWASYNIGVFLCSTCAAIHRGLGSHISRVKSLRLDNWDKIQVANMEQMGNVKANSFYLQYLPIHWQKPNDELPLVLRDQWIRAKYERKEFVTVTSSADETFLQGYLWKKGKKNLRFLKRKFVLNQQNGRFVLKYYNKSSEKKAKTSLATLDINVVLSERFHPHGMTISSRRDQGTRRIYVYSDDAKTIVDWYTAIRGCKLHDLQTSFPTTPLADLVPHLTQEPLLEGYMYKTGPRIGDAYHRRFFELYPNKLIYSDEPMSAYPKGEIFLHSKTGLSVQGIPCGLKERGFGFMLLTPERTWMFGCDKQDERDKWVRLLTQTISSRSSIHAERITRLSSCSSSS